MDIGYLPSQIKNKKRMWHINMALLAAVACICLLTFLVGEEESCVSEIKLPQRKKQNYEEIGWGPLSLNGLRSQGPLPFLTKELVVLGKNDRPDSQRSFLLGLNSSQEEIMVAERQPIFLVKGDDDKWHFSLSKTPLCVSAAVSDNDNDKVVVHVTSSEEEGSFALRAFDKTGDNIEKMPYVKALQNAKFWGPDLLIQNYGGRDYRDLLKKNKVEVSGRIYFVGEGDLLVWKEGEWKEASYQNIPPLVPIAKVVRQTSSGVQFQIWDESGFHKILSHKSLENSQKTGHKAEELFSSVRVRTPTEITCLLGKRRVILREGDWWLKMDSGWKKLKTVSDIEDYLDHRLRGELFIFESIAADKGKVVLKGNSFDMMRTEMQPLSLTTSIVKKSHSLSKKPGKESPPMIAKTEDVLSSFPKKGDSKKGRP